MSTRALRLRAKAPNIRLSRTLGGGPVGDLGVYCINAARYVTNEEPVEVTAFVMEAIQNTESRLISAPSGNARRPKAPA